MFLGLYFLNNLDKKVVSKKSEIFMIFNNKIITLFFYVLHLQNQTGRCVNIP